MCLHSFKVYMHSKELSTLLRIRCIHVCIMVQTYKKVFWPVTENYSELKAQMSMQFNLFYVIQLYGS